jgi:hypothetical protein
LPTICQQITKRGHKNTLRGDHLERFAVWPAPWLRAVGLFDIDES